MASGQGAKIVYCHLQDKLDADCSSLQLHKWAACSSSCCLRKHLRSSSLAAGSC